MYANLQMSTLCKCKTPFLDMYVMVETPIRSSTKFRLVETPIRSSTKFRLVEAAIGNGLNNTWSFTYTIIEHRVFTVRSSINSTLYELLCSIQVSLQIRPGIHDCAGAVLTIHFVITAAHCVDDHPKPRLSCQRFAICGCHLRSRFAISMLSCMRFLCPIS